MGPIPWALATADGHMVKSSKAQLMHTLEREASNCEEPSLGSSVQIVDGNALLQSIVGLPENFGQLAEQVFRLLPKAGSVHFVTDSYKPASIKQMERDRRGNTAAFNIGGPLTKLPNDFKAFMLNADNKQQLIRLLLCEWKSPNYARRLHGRNVYFVCETECVCLTSDDGVTTTATDIVSLQSDQEEADTRIILHCLFVTATAPTDSTIIVLSPDTDVMVLLLAYAHKVQLPLLFDTGTGNKRRLVDIQSIAASIGPEVCSGLPALHAVTGCDYTSAFVRRGKTKPQQLLQHNDDFIQLFSQLGIQPELSPDNFAGIERFVCSMYSRQVYSDINKLRFELFQSRYEMKADFNTMSVGDGIDVSLLPPCRSSLLMHARRANYVTYLWRNSHVPFANIPPPDGFGWETTPDGLINIVWNDGDIMPQKLVDILESESNNNAQHCDAEIEEDSEIDNILDVMFEVDEDD